MTLEIKEPELTKPVLVNIKGDVRQLRERLEQYNQFNQININNLNGKDEKLAFELRRELMRLRTEALAFVEGLDSVYENFEQIK